MNQDTSPTLTIKCIFPAPRNRVFDAWTNLNSDIGWWGPKGFTLLFDEKDLKPGGRWRMGMVRQGEKNILGGVYREIVPPMRLVMTHAWEDAEGKPGHGTLVTITLNERNDKTEMVFAQTGFESAASRDGHREGWNEAFDALTTALGSEAEFRPPATSTAQTMSMNKLTVQKYLNGFRKSDHAEVLSCLTDDVEWVIPGRFHITGKAAYDKEIENDAFVGSPTITITRLTENDNVVIAEGSVRCRKKGGGDLNAAICDVFVLRDAKVKHHTSYVMEVKE